LKNSYKLIELCAFRAFNVDFSLLKLHVEVLRLNKISTKALTNARMTYASSAWEICGRRVVIEFPMPAGRTALLADGLCYYGIITNFADQVFVGQRRRNLAINTKLCTLHPVYEIIPIETYIGSAAVGIESLMKHEREIVHPPICG
jgi:hypothetical protein